MDRIGLFAHDDFRITRRLTINAGLRYEYTTVPHEVNDRIESTFA